MKLLFCQECWDVFKLDVGPIRTCKCGKVKGRYINNSEAEVTDNAISLAIGNGSLEMAIYNMQVHKEMTDNKASRGEYYETGKGKIEFAWVRPNSGPGNPHTRIMKEDDDNAQN